MTIQEMIIKRAMKFSPGCTIHIRVIQLEVLTYYHKELSYKQVRDGLYRTREKFLFIHTGRGYYRWMV